MCFIPKSRSAIKTRRRIWGWELENVVGRVCVGWGHANQPGAWEGFSFIPVGTMITFHLTARPPRPVLLQRIKYSLGPISRPASHDPLLAAKG